MPTTVATTTMKVAQVSNPGGEFHADAITEVDRL
jgi:hypothetical protein